MDYRPGHNTSHVLRDVCVRLNRLSKDMEIRYFYRLLFISLPLLITHSVAL